MGLSIASSYRAGTITNKYALVTEAVQAPSGIGDTSPDYQLELSSAAASDPSFAL